jgi:hypothetical protein
LAIKCDINSLDFVHKGGFGTLFKAREKDTQQYSSIKIIPVKKSMDGFTFEFVG